jgi:cell division transport system permease protein
MRLGLFSYFLRQSARNLSQNRLVHALCMGTMVISMLILGGFCLVYVNVSAWIQGWDESWSMSVYLRDDVSDHQRQALAAYLSHLPSAEIKRFISKDAALREFKRILGPQASLLDGLENNPLPASFEVVFRKDAAKRQDLYVVRDEIERMAGVEEVQYSEEWLGRLESFIHMARAFGLVVGGLLCVGVLFIISNTIKLTIYSRREEIEVMKMVGATDWFIRVPFLVEGLLQGMISGALSIAILFLFYYGLTIKKVPWFGFAGLGVDFLPLEYTLYIVILCMVLGIFGSFVAIGRFFDV